MPNIYQSSLTLIGFCMLVFTQILLLYLCYAPNQTVTIYFLNLKPNQEKPNVQSL
jgi:hypothetical protein